MFHMPINLARGTANTATHTVTDSTGRSRRPYLPHSSGAPSDGMESEPLKEDTLLQLRAQLYLQLGFRIWVSRLRISRRGRLLRVGLCICLPSSGLILGALPISG
ncbi:hypothetical protein BDV93DRAFT_289475 [Ceratobasidium sp. AG-I]|nr:hypothetical protein BDV93DRAFT_289475 [Ceratobasidium sp. AG-I]